MRDAQLLMELGPGRGHIGTVQQLLDQVAANQSLPSQSQHADGDVDLREQTPPAAIATVATL